MEIKVCGNADSFSIAALCCYGDMCHTAKKNKKYKVRKDYP